MVTINNPDVTIFTNDFSVISTNPRSILQKCSRWGMKKPSGKNIKSTTFYQHSAQNKPRFPLFFGHIIQKRQLQECETDDWADLCLAAKIGPLVLRYAFLHVFFFPFLDLRLLIKTKIKYLIICC